MGDPKYRRLTCLVIMLSLLLLLLTVMLAGLGLWTLLVHHQHRLHYYGSPQRNETWTIRQELTSLSRSIQGLDETLRQNGFPAAVQSSSGTGGKQATKTNNESPTPPDDEATDLIPKLASRPQCVQTKKPRNKPGKGLADIYKQVSDMWKDGMRPEVDPCDDFYEFMCGNLKQTKEPGYSRLAEAQKTLKSRMSWAMQQLQPNAMPAMLIRPVYHAKRLSDLCPNATLNTEMETLSRIVSLLKGSPLLGDPIDEVNPFQTALTLQKLLGRLENLESVSGPDFLSAYKTQSDHYGFETDVLELQFSTELFLPQYLSKYIHVTVAYAKYIGQEVGKDLNKQVEEIVESTTLYLEKVVNITEISLQAQDMETPVRPEGSELLFTAVLDSLPENVEISARLFSYVNWVGLSSAMPLFVEATMEHRAAIQTAIIGRLLSLFFNETGAPGVHIGNCEDVIIKLNEPIMQRIFVENFGPNEASQIPVRALIEHIRSQLINRVLSLTWIDTYSKNRVLNKINSIIPRIGYAPWILNDTLLADYYTDLRPMTKSPSFLDLYSSLHELHFIRVMNRFKYRKGAKYNRFLENSNSFDTNAAYHPGENTINVYLGIMQPPIFDFGYPIPMIYGMLGFVIAHEITHSVDTQGMLFDLRGDFERWVSGTTMREFHNRTSCFVGQFSNYCYNITGTDLDPKVNNQSTHVGSTACLDGEVVVSENIADDGGIKLAFDAFREFHFFTDDRYAFDIPGFEEYSDDQMFFMSMASGWCEVTDPARLPTQLQDPHSPAPSRINGTLQNFPPFSEAFQCKRGETMNPVKKCSLW